METGKVGNIRSLNSKEKESICECTDYIGNKKKETRRSGDGGWISIEIY